MTGRGFEVVYDWNSEQDEDAHKSSAEARNATLLNGAFMIDVIMAGGGPTGGVRNPV